MELRGDWKAIRAVHRLIGVKFARVWSETPFIDTSAISAELPELNKYGLPHKGGLKRMPLCPVVVRLCRNQDLMACDCMIRKHHIKDVGHGIIEHAKSIGMNTDMLSNALNNIDDYCYALYFMYEWDKQSLLKIEADNMIEMVIPGMIYFPSTGDCLTIGTQIESKIAGSTVIFVLELFDEIENRGKHVVEVEEIVTDTMANLHSQKNGPTNRAKKIKPWTRTDLRKAILINFAEAKKYGHRTNHNNTHASPIPHVRRGHFVTLRNIRYGKNIGKKIWRKQAWVGDTEWIFEGRRYKVIDGVTQDNNYEKARICLTGTCSQNARRAS